MTNYAKNYACTIFQSLKTMTYIFTQYEKICYAPKQIQMWAPFKGLYGSFRSHIATQYDRKCFLDTVDTGISDIYSRFMGVLPRPERSEVTQKSAIYTRKRHEEHPSHFYMGVPPENRPTDDLKRERTGVCAVQDYSMP